MFYWSVFLVGSWVCLVAASPVASGPRVILRGGSVDARSMRLLMNAQPRGGRETLPECVLNPAAMGFAMGEDSPYFNPDNQQMLVDEEADDRGLTETAEEEAVPAEDDNTLPELPEGRVKEPEETTPAQTTPAEEEGTTVTTTEHADEAESTTETRQETTTPQEEEWTTTEAAEEQPEQPDEEKANPEAETPDEEPKAAEEPAPGGDPADKDCGSANATPGSRRKSKARPVEEEEEPVEEAPRKRGRGGSVYKNFFPVTLGDNGPSRSRDQEEGAGGRGNGPVTAIANSFSQGRGAIASSSAVAHGSPDAGEYRHGRRSRYRL